MPWLHRFARLVAASTLVLIVAGGLVTSTGSGLAVPDWPTTYGWSMFTFPLSKMAGGILYEHGHRLIASMVGLLTIVLAVWLWKAESRRLVRWLGVTALVAVVLQGVLGGITVLFFLPAPVSVAHAGLAQIFFCLTVSLALFTSPGWLAAYQPLGGPVQDAALRRVAATTTALVYTQILIGATMRHTEAGLAIPDFPLAFGGLVPHEWSAAIAIHYAHRAGGLIVALAIVATCGHVWAHHRERRDLLRPALLATALVIAQITLGGLTVLSGKAVAINTAHVAVGALVLATMLIVTLRAFRLRFAGATDTASPVRQTPVVDRGRAPARAGANA